MKQLLMALTVTLILNPLTFADGVAKVKTTELECFGSRSYPSFDENLKGDSVKIYLNGTLQTVAESKVATLSFDSSIIYQSEFYLGGFKENSISSFSGKDITNEEYKGKKYKNHLKFKLTYNENVKSLGADIEKAEFIVSPEYTVVKTVPQHNLSTPEWKWDVEVRKHSAVMDFQVHDQTGDYVPMECYSSEMVNEVHPKKLK